MRAATFLKTFNGSTIAPVTRSVRARFAMRTYEGLCREGVFQIEYRTSEFKSAAAVAAIEAIEDTALR
jgi:hypothetical protein